MTGEDLQRIVQAVPDDQQPGIAHIVGRLVLGFRHKFTGQLTFGVTLESGEIQAITISEGEHVTLSRKLKGR
jgi:hypothetical protein